MGSNLFSFAVLFVVFRPSEGQNIRTLKLALDPKYTSLLPLSNQYYITELSSTPRMQCFLLCLQQIDTCAGTLVNTDALQCKLIKSHLNGLSLDVNNPVPGWSFWAVAGGCASGWTAYNGHCYIRETTPLSFNDGQTYCQHLSAYLVEINDLNENTWITQVLLKDVYCANPYACGTWTGGNDISVQDSFVWIGSNTPFTFTNWDGSNPDDASTTELLDCVEIFYLGSWNDRPCPDLRPFICEK